MSLKTPPRRNHRTLIAVLAILALVAVWALIDASCAARPVGAQTVDPMDSWLPCPVQDELPPGAICIKPTPTGIVIIDPWIEELTPRSFLSVVKN